MQNKIIFPLLICLSMASASALAHSCDKCKKGKKLPSPWDGSNALIGFVRNTGNTSSSTLNLTTNVLYKKPRWQNVFLGEFQYGKQNGKSNRQYYHFNDQAQVFLDPLDKGRNFFFGNGDVVITRFGPYNYMMVSAAGYGRELWRNDKFQLSAQAGPGYRRNKKNEANSKVSGAAVFTTQANASLKLGKWGTFTQSARFDLAKPYNYLQTVSAITNQIWDHIAVQLSYTLTYYSQIPSGSSDNDKLDTMTNISLVYNY